jgi:tryptophan 2,3-dioxygenase
VTVEERDETAAPGFVAQAGGPPAVVSEEIRLARAEATGGQPQMAFEGATPYDHYVRTDVLHSIQQTFTDVPEERAFLVASQIMELYFGQLRAEWELAQQHLRKDDVRGAVVVLRRSVRQFEALVASWSTIDWLTPMEFNRFRDHLGVASGFQSWAYRRLELLLGIKQRKLTYLYKKNPAVHGPLMEAFEGPSLYDDAIAALARGGMDIPESVVHRDYSEDYEPRPEVEAAWLQIYTREQLGDPRWELAEVLTDISAAFTDWRHRHLMAVRRGMGAQVGSGGSSGTAWLEKSLARVVFPEVWSARTAV